MTKPPLNNKGFGLLGILAVIVVLCAVGGAGAYVYQQNHKTKTVASASQTGKTKTPPPVNPYAGWKTYTLASTGLSFKYPADWTLKDQSIPSANIYSALLSGSDQLTMTIGVSPSGGTGGDDAGILASEPITSLGASYYLNYEGLQSDNGMVDRAMLSTSSTTKYDSPKLAGQSDTVVSAQVDFVNAGSMIAKSLASFKSDPSFQQAKLVIESMAD